MGRKICIAEGTNVNVPSNEIGGEALLVEPPVIAVGGGAHLHTVPSRGEARLDDAVAVDEDLACDGIDLQGVPHVRLQKLVDRVHRAQLPMRSDNEWFYTRMGLQPGPKSQSSVLQYFKLKLLLLAVAKSTFIKAPIKLNKFLVGASILRYLPMIDELVNTRVVRANVSLGELPQPIAGGVGGRREHALCPGAIRAHRREAELDRHRL